MKCIVQSNGGDYLTPRRATGCGMYESRSGWSADINDAKVFNTKAAAANSANQCKDTRSFLVLEIEYVVTP